MGDSEYINTRISVANVARGKRWWEAGEVGPREI